MAHHHHDHAQTAHHHDHTQIDFAEMLPLLEREADLYAPMYRQAADWLRERQPEPELIVDAGSGPGVISCLLADAFPQARVVAVDGAEPLLEAARARAERLGIADRFSTLEAELADGLGDLDYRADLLWASKSLHHVGDQRAALAGFAQALAPGGTLALLEGGLTARCLPRDIGIGRPGLQSRIDAVHEDWFTEMRATLPGSVRENEDWPGLLAAVGLRPTGSRTFLLDLPAPLSQEARAFVVATFQRRRDFLGEVLDASDLATLDRLLDPDDKESLHHRPDVYLLSAQTVHTAQRGEGAPAQ
ncbi:MULTISPECIES: class I SAM-dependent methyltransferase [Streptomyces]|uniref:Class I SAM-dependent methyltransferase n=1 Tax=Streptomyces dengpaensis TaxID=2049881 RepID=A0ABM6SLI4_9ACTN|nr:MULTISPECIES: class I SAM-dependent methyltransferase [Streptomyces]AVH55447.1 class I SAM-dependent methyltransferase [Streptomyces dengpaensis]PIB11714.1 SAM-dependent methyltransferase [Streptomyces sp. HG99]